MTGKAADKLADYRDKRNFSRTSEPSGSTATGGARRGREQRYVIHRHAASHHHYDLRLEADGVLRSWALPKGVSLRPGEKRLAIEVEDHPLEYADFEGVIPRDEYGGGTVMLWDRGRWWPGDTKRQDRLDIELEGDKLTGSWTLVRTSRSGKRDDGASRQWLMIRRRGAIAQDLRPHDRSVATNRTMEQIATAENACWDPASSSRRCPPPDPAEVPGARALDIDQKWRPQLAAPVECPPDGDEWLHEVKFDGYRLLAVLVGSDRPRLFTRNGKDWSHRVPALVESLATLPVSAAVLDGELVAFDRNGTSNFTRLQEILGAGGNAKGLAFQVFDLLYLDGFDLRDAPLRLRKQKLEELLSRAHRSGLDARRIKYSRHIQANGTAMLEHACELGLEGVVSKKGDSPYRAGRSRSWVKSKCTVHEEFVVGGYCAPAGGRRGFASLLLGGYRDGRLQYMGRVGTGFSAVQIDQLLKRLKNLALDETPFASTVPAFPAIQWVEPQLVIEIEFTERTGNDYLRHPVYRGLREDRDPQEVTASDRVSAAEGVVQQPSRRADTSGSAPIEGVTLTNPERVVFPDQGISKLDLALYYQSVEAWLLPWLMRRPLSLLRCPGGPESKCFYQKHPRSRLFADLPRVDITNTKGKTSRFCYVESIRHVIALLQAGVLEIHPWGCDVDNVETPDTIVFDMDPAEDVGWKTLVDCARDLRHRLDSLGLASFVKLTGGKGVHIVVPVVPQLGWEEIKGFAFAVAAAHAGDDPGRLTTNMSKRQRRGRIFIDCLRNGRGNTAIAAYSTRARPGAPLAVPLRWDELAPGIAADRYDVGNIHRRLRALRKDPWADFERARRPLSKKMRRAVGLG